MSKQNQAKNSAQVSDDQARIAIENDHIQLRAYQLHQAKGGSRLDNWLEAERTIRNIQ